MILGILSDTHGHADAARAGVAALLAGGAEHLIHCGDVGSTDVIDALVGQVPALFVFGNCDDDRGSLARYAASVGVRCGGVSASLELDGKHIVVTHGDDERAVRRALVAIPETDYLFVGHTHRAADRRDASGTRVMNPGALHRVAAKTVALLDTRIDSFMFLDIAAT